MTSRPDGPFRDGKVHVLDDKCSTCVFRPGNQMHLQAGRVKGMVDESIEDGGAITCHQTLEYNGSYEAEPAVCRGFWDSYRDRVQALQLAERLNMVEFDEQPTEVTHEP
jgi:hypothetical protein